VGRRVEEKGGREGVVIMFFKEQNQIWERGSERKLSYLSARMQLAPAYAHVSYYSVKRDLL
jgi:hypothetical protein